jgi:hypothetical protein
MATSQFTAMRAESLTFKYQKFSKFQGDSLQSAYYGSGYAQAEDRLWQIHVKRMVSQGRLSEVLGEATVSID